MIIKRLAVCHRWKCRLLTPASWLVKKNIVTNASVVSSTASVADTQLYKLRGTSDPIVLCFIYDIRCYMNEVPGMTQYSVSSLWKNKKRQLWVTDSHVLGRYNISSMPRYAVRLACIIGVFSVYYFASTFPILWEHWLRCAPMRVSAPWVSACWASLGFIADIINSRGVNAKDDEGY